MQSSQTKLLKEIYRSGQERITYLLSLVGTAQTDSLKASQSPEEWTRYHQVLRALSESLKFDKSEGYSRAVEKVTNWCLNARDPEYQKLCEQHSKSNIYAIRKGLEFLQVVLYRDRRRTIMDSEESRRFYIFCQLTDSMPPQTETNGDSASKQVTNNQL